ncbi:MAG TPA: glycosyltransferase family 2 protein, partial [Candidatus Handelsmanbacteria bacterium]|nr:glycosyltransferase family 2 protein [Candidatus Handelsmanbacteria bacterium]
MAPWVGAATCLTTEHTEDGEAKRQERPSSAALAIGDPMTLPTIACVIPAYNREGFIGRAVRSALEQVSPPQEIIVVDDGSTDGTGSVVREMGAQVRYIPQENAGGAEARNRGAREANSEWIAFLDSDDYWTPNHLKRVREAIAGTQGRADFYFANIRRSQPEGGHDQWQQAHFRLQEAWKLREDGQGWVLRPRIPMMLQATVFHRQRFLQKGGLRSGLKRRHDTH